MLIKKHILLQIIATTLLGITSASASEGEVDTLLQRIQLISSENPQESRQLASAMYKLAKQTKNPDNVAKAYMAYTEIYIANNLWKQANAYIDSAMAIAKRYKNYRQQAELQILLGKLNYRADNPRLGSEAINDAIKLASISRDNDLLVRIKLIQADFIKQKGNFTESITIKNQALNIAAMDKLKSSEADCHLSIGSSYWQMGQFNEALECYYKALLIEGQINDTLGLIHTFKNLGLTYRELGQYEKCLSVLNRGLNLSKKTNNKYETGEILNILGSLHFRFSQFDEAIRYYNQSLSIREELGLTRSQILTHENIARVLSQKSQFDEALDHLNTALQLQSQITDPLAEASTLTEMGNLNLQKGNIAEALRRYLMVLKLRQSFGQDEDVAKSLTNIGLAYRKLGMYKSSLKYMEQAHDIINAKELNTNDAAYILQNLGHIYQDVKQFNKAIGTYKEALALKEKGGDESGTSKILQNIAQVQLQMQHISKARSSLSQALKISNRLKDAREVADIYNEMGNVERQANNPDMAIKYYKNAASQYQALLNPEGKALCLRKIGEIQIERKQFADAEQNINQSIKTGYQAGNAHLLSYGYLAKYNLLRAKGNYKQALEHYIKHTSIRDSLENIKRNETNLEAQLDLELDQKKTEIKVMEAEVETLMQKAALDKANIAKQKTFRNFLIAVALLLVTIAGATTFNFVQKRKYAKALEEKIDEINLINGKLLQSEKDLKQTVQTKDKLFSIIAHDLRSPFTALVGLSEVLSTKTKELSPEEVSEFSNHIHRAATGVLELTENLLSWSRSQTGRLVLTPNIHPLETMINSIVKVAKIPAKEKGVEIANMVTPKIQIYADYDTVSTAIRNLVSNAIKFTPTGGHVFISAKELIGSTEIKITDTGVGIESENLAKLFRVDGVITRGTNQESGTGLGLILCKEFIEKNNGTVAVDSAPGIGTTFTIVLPKKSPSNEQKTA